MKIYGLTNKILKMKNISFKYMLLGFLLSMGLVACNDFEDENYDFSNTAAPYVEIAGDVAGLPGEDVAVNFRLRVAMHTTTVNVDYEITGDITQSGTVAIEAGDLSAAVPVTLPTTPETGTATVKITGVDNGLTIGRASSDDNVETSISWEPE